MGCLVRYSTYSTYSMDPGERVGGQRAQLCVACGKGVRQSGGQRAQLCVFGQGLTSVRQGCAPERGSARPTVRLWARLICMRSVGLLPGLCP